MVLHNQSDLTSAKRVVVKVGSSSISGENQHKIEKLVDALAAAHKTGQEVILVTSGAIATGMPLLNLESKPDDLATSQALASVGQGRLISRYQSSLERYDLIAGQVLLTAQDLEGTETRENAKRAMERLVSLRVIPIVNENDTVATAEIRFGDNDRLAALAALLVQADLLVLISDVDALYDAHPSQAGAKAIHEVANFADIDSVEVGGAGSAGVGSGGMVTKIEAARIATSAGTPMLLTSLAQSADSLVGKEFGTIFHAQASKANSRLLWLAHASSARGRLVLDAGAVTAILEKGVSLLPAGVTAVEGEFSAGDTVELASKDGKVIARGLVAFDSTEIPQMLGRSTKELAAALGAEYERELVHRDDLVLL